MRTFSASLLLLLTLSSATWRSSAAEPAIEWMPDAIHASAIKNEQTIIYTSFRVTQPFDRLSVDWQLGDFWHVISEVEPKEFANLSPGDAHVIYVTISPSDLSLQSGQKLPVPGVLNGSIGLFSHAEKDLLDSSVPIHITITSAAPVELPPDPNVPLNPGKEINQDVAGIDSDNDGVRDDVQRYITITYEDPSKRLALLSYARALQISLIEADLLSRSVLNATERQHAIECLYYLNDKAPIEELEEMRSDLQARILNTEARTRAYFTSMRHLDGHRFEFIGSRQAACGR